MEEGAPQAEEQVLAQWEQPQRVGRLSTRQGATLIYGAGLGLSALLVILAVWRRDLNFGLAAAVIVAALLATRNQNKTAALPVTVTNFRVIIGKREYPLSTLAGFWLVDEGDVVEVNLEAQKPGLIPTTFLGATPSGDEVRSLFSQVLPELEPRERRLGDKIGTYFRL